LDRRPAGLGYLFFAIYSIIVLFDFREKLRKRLVALSVLFSEKKEILLSLYGLFHKAKLPLDGDMKAVGEAVVEVSIPMSSNEKQAMAAITLLNDFQRRLSLLSEEERYIQKSPDFESYVNSLKDLENNYHRIVAAYNTDLNGYEYWRQKSDLCLADLAFWFPQTGTFSLKEQFVVDEAIVEIFFVADDDDAARIAFDRIEEGIFGFLIQMVRRFIENEEVALFERHDRKAGFGDFTARKLAHRPDREVFADPNGA
jgi:hypothetical protein